MTVQALHTAWIAARLEWLSAIRDESDAGRSRRQRAVRRREEAIELLAMTAPSTRSDMALQLHVWWTEFGPPDDWPDPGATYVASLWRTLTGEDGDPRCAALPQSTLE